MIFEPCVREDCTNSGGTDGNKQEREHLGPILVWIINIVGEMSKLEN